MTDDGSVDTGGPEWPTTVDAGAGPMVDTALDESALGVAGPIASSQGMEPNYSTADGHEVHADPSGHIDPTETEAERAKRIEAHDRPLEKTFIDRVAEDMLAVPVEILGLGEEAAKAIAIAVAHAAADTAIEAPPDAPDYPLPAPHDAGVPGGVGGGSESE